MKKIEDLIRDLVGPDYHVSDPVYQSNDWWICYKHAYLYVVFVSERGQSRQSCIVIVANRNMKEIFEPFNQSIIMN